MKLSKRILACTACLAVATTMLTATYASADVTETAKPFSEAPEYRKNGIDLSANDVFSCVSALPDRPTVGISVQMGGSYTFRGLYSDVDVTLDSAGTYVDGDANNKYKLTYTYTPWAHYYVHAAQVASTSDGKKITSKRGADQTVGVIQPGGAPNIYMDADGNVVDVPDTNNIPEGVIQYFQESELKDAVITGNGTYKAAIVNHDFDSDSDDEGAGFNMLSLTSNVGYFNGQVSNKAFKVDASALKSAVAEAEAFLPTLQTELEELKKTAEGGSAEEPTEEATEAVTEEATDEAVAAAEEPTEEVTEAAGEETTEAEATVEEKIAKLEENIAALEAAIASGKEAVANDGKALPSDYSLKATPTVANFYDSKESYEAGVPDRNVSIKGYTTRSPYDGSDKTYDFTEVNIVDTYSDKKFTDFGTGIESVTLNDNGTHSAYISGDKSVVKDDGQLDAIGALHGASTVAMPKYALEVEFTVSDADVFAAQAAVDSSLEAVSEAMTNAGGLVWAALDSAIAEAEAINKDEYTSASYDKMMAAVEAGKAVKAKFENGEEVTQDEIDAATAAIKEAIASLEPIAPDPTNDPNVGSSGTQQPSSDNGGNGSGNSSTDANPGTGAGIAVTASMAVLVAAGYIITRKRK